MFLKNGSSKAIDLFFVIILNANSNLTVSVSKQTSVVNVCRSHNDPFIIDNHQFTVDVNDFSNRDFVKDISLSQPKKVNVLSDLCLRDSTINESLKQTVFSPRNCLILPMHLDSEYCRSWVCDVSFEAWK